MTKTTVKNLAQLPGVLAFQRGVLVSDALFYNEINGGLTPLQVIRHGIRGTQNVNEGDEAAETAVKASAAREVVNVQVTETAKLAPEADALVVRFSVKASGLDNALHSCASSAKAKADFASAFRESYVDFLGRVKTSEGLQEVARRLARNIANGRWLWRNRVQAATVEVTVRHGDKVVASFDALKVSLKDFDSYSPDENKVAEILARQMLGAERTGLDVEARLTFGMKGALEVYPSQNYIEKDRNAKGFARSLYKVGQTAQAARYPDIEAVGQAALRDQKIGNALRTIDTWYADYGNIGKPIAVEPIGANLEFNGFFRDKTNASFELFKRLGTVDPDSAEGMFCIAALLRGGVYSQSEKTKPESPKPATDTPAADATTEGDA